MIENSAPFRKASSGDLPPAETAGPQIGTSVAGRPFGGAEMVADLRSVLIGLLMVIVVFAVAAGIAHPTAIFH